MDADALLDDVAPGRLVAQRYRLRSPVGHGAAGAAWLATDEDRDRDVTVQRLRSTAGLAPGVAEQQRGRSVLHGRTAAQLRDDHAVAVLDVAVDDGDPWLVTEHLPGRDLADVVASSHVLPVAQVAQIGAQVADAMVSAHAAGILHRGITPATVLVGQGGDTDGMVRITDLGLDRERDELAVTDPGLLRGTPAYLAPEVARGQEPTPASDVHALGATLFACLEGTPPYGLDDDAEVLRHRVATGRHRTPTRAVVLEPVLLGMLDADPARRPTMAAVRDELASIAAGRRRQPADVLTARTHLTPISFAVVGIAAGVRAAAAADGGRTADPTAAAAADASADTTELVAAGPDTTELVAAPAAVAAHGRRRTVLRRPAAVAAAVAAVTVAAAAAYLVARASSPAPAAGASTSTATTAPATSAVAPLTAAESEQAVRTLVSRLPADPAGALASAGPVLRAVGVAALRDYLAGVTAVALQKVVAQDGGTVSAGLVLTLSDGTTRTEQVTFTVTRPVSTTPAAASALVVDSVPLAALVSAGPPPTNPATPTTTRVTNAPTTRARATTTTVAPVAPVAPPVRSTAPAPAPATTGPTTGPTTTVAPTTPTTAGPPAPTSSTAPTTTAGVATSAS
ncbi:serine/threonine protein kinase [Rhodococcus antarcticus]|uniref:non-specific serine/threonine protein kinase n=1 Tax=Rhodococcus antarcticus TaxID=2987751 RepID=A0ABY6P149_9NOCA|nr:serine/threonine-protein kinase [Rhodococcus antarcticus]UZJ25390.1 serine/threonine protein kinase [Rhodococcus antarcticus]